jgi:hypothetical protein
VVSIIEGFGFGPKLLIFADEILRFAQDDTGRRFGATVNRG